MATDNNFFIVTPGTSLLWKNGPSEFRMDIVDDPDPTNPRDDECLGHMVCWHKSYRLGDNHDYASPYQFLYHLAAQLNCLPENSEEDEDVTTFSDLMTALEPHVLILPLWLYDHSGISIACGTTMKWPYNDQWDSSQVGWTYITRDEFVANTGNTEENWKINATEILKAETQVYSAYLEGSVYGYIFYNKVADHWGEIDSCYGFYGSDALSNGMFDNMPPHLFDNLRSGTFEIVNTDSIPVPEPEQNLVVETPMGKLIARPIKEAEHPGIYINLTMPGYHDELGMSWTYYDERGKNFKSRVFGEALMDEPTHEETYTNINKFFHQKGPLADDANVVYICAPYSGSDEECRQNVENAKRYGLFAIKEGYVPYIAHLAICGFLNDKDPKERDIGIQADTIMLRRCDELWVFGARITPGMREEIEFFHELQKPIKYFNIEGEVPELVTTE